jgi:hypothetical protein
MREDKLFNVLSFGNFQIDGLDDDGEIEFFVTIDKTNEYNGYCNHFLNQEELKQLIEFLQKQIV